MNDIDEVDNMEILIERNPTGCSHRFLSVHLKPQHMCQEPVVRMEAKRSLKWQHQCDRHLILLSTFPPVIVCLFITIADDFDADLSSMRLM